MNIQIPAAPVTATDLADAGLLDIGTGCRIHPTAVFIPADYSGTLRTISIGDRCVIGAHATIHGGTILRDDVHIGHGVIVGEPEHGYAVRRTYPGAGAITTIEDRAVIRAGAIIYAAVTIGADSTIGHHTLLRSKVTIGTATQLGHHLTVERGARIGNQVRCSPGSHITADTRIDDGAFLGAGVRTVNDKHLIWRDPDHEQPLSPPRFGPGCKIGSGAVIAAGVAIGAQALVGSGSIVTKDVANSTIAYGNPARPQGMVKE